MHIKLNSLQIKKLVIEYNYLQSIYKYAQTNTLHSCIIMDYEKYILLVIINAKLLTLWRQANTHEILVLVLFIF